MGDFNIINLFIISFLILMIGYGFLNPVSRNRIHYFIGSLYDSIEFIGALVLSIYFTGKIFISNTPELDAGIYSKIYSLMPQIVKDTLYGRGILTYIICVPVILLILLMGIRLITTPLYRIVVEPLTGLIYSVVDKCGFMGRGLLGVFWRLPKAFLLIFILGIGVNFYTYYNYNPELNKLLDGSSIYQVLYKSAIYPVVNSNIAKKIPVIVNDSFSKAVTPASADEYFKKSSAGKLMDQLSGGNFRIIEYYNGVTLEQAIKSNPKIDGTAVEIVGNETDSGKKAYIIYKWVSQNINYDFEKAEKLSTDPSGISSGSIVAFNTRKGVCFDYSSLYISMCRAVGVKVRLITGLGYSGEAWGDHAWNQAFYEEENRWINVDATFGSSANYFDKNNFNMDHKYSEIQGEW